uniref:Uncharacterized protein n=1 Tax=Arundo donax TaxID=35708 RepID=A0A0A8Y8A1_ARUDO
MGSTPLTIIWKGSGFGCRVQLKEILQNCIIFHK